MYDINLFERYKAKPKKTNFFALSIFLIFVLLIGLIAFSEYRYYAEKKALENNIAELREFTSNPETIKLLSEINDKDKKNQEMINDIQKIQVIEDYISYNDVIDEKLLLNISSSVPENCFVNNVSISPENVSLAGYADSYETVANFEHRFRSKNIVYMLFNPSISEENANYSFSFAARLRKEFKNEN